MSVEKKSLVNINWKNLDDNDQKNPWPTLAKISHDWRQWENNPNQHHLKKILIDIGKKIALVDIIQKNSDRKNLGQRQWKITYVDIDRKNFSHP